MEAVCGLNVTQVTEALASASSHQVLVIDCRSFMAFNQSHIVESINVRCPPILKRRSGGFISLENIVPCETKRSQLINGSFPCVLVYDDNTQELSHVSGDSNLLSVIRSLQQQVDSLQVRFIIGGFDAIREECPVLCMNQDVKLTHFLRDKTVHSDKGSNIQNEPAEILPYLYLGDVSHSSQRALLDQLGITALLNVSSSCENLFQSHYRYMNVQVNDNMEADLISWFPKLIEFIDSVASEHGKVLVHCRAGVSRSATICIAYLMQKQGLSLDSAFEFVVSRRPIIDPNLNFIQQLQKFETYLRAQHQLQLPTITTSSASTCSLQARSAPPLHTAEAFTFNPERTNSYLSSPSSGQDVLLTSLSAACAEQDQQLSSTKHLSSNATQSPCLNFSSATHAHRPVSLPLLQMNCQPSAQRRRSSSFLSTYSHQPHLQVSPLLNIFHESSESPEQFIDSYVFPPRTPLANSRCSFLNSDIVTCQSLTIPGDMGSPRQCRPTTPGVLDSNPGPYLGAEHSYSAVGVVHSPLSPLAVPPLSPLPSCG